MMIRVKKDKSEKEKENRERDRLKKKWMEVIRKDLRICGVDENMVIVKERRKTKIRVSDPYMLGMKLKIIKKKKKKKKKNF